MLCESTWIIHIIIDLSFIAPFFKLMKARKLESFPEKSWLLQPFFPGIPHGIYGSLHRDSAGPLLKFVSNVTRNKRMNASWGPWERLRVQFVNHETVKTLTEALHAHPNVEPEPVYQQMKAVFVIISMCLADKTSNGQLIFFFIPSTWKFGINCRIGRSRKGYRVLFCVCFCLCVCISHTLCPLMKGRGIFSVAMKDIPSK